MIQIIALTSLIIFIDFIANLFFCLFYSLGRDFVPYQSQSVHYFSVIPRLIHSVIRQRAILQITQNSGVSSIPLRADSSLQRRHDRQNRGRFEANGDHREHDGDNQRQIRVNSIAKILHLCDHRSDHPALHQQRQGIV